MQKVLMTALLAMGGIAQVGAQSKQDSSSKVFSLGEIVAYGGHHDSTSTITMEQIRQFHRLNVSTSLHLLPGISQSNVGPRNESMIYLRGFDLRQTPVFIDGVVPVYVPYDGYVDLARFTTSNLSKIVVEKGGALSNGKTWIIRTFILRMYPNTKLLAGCSTIFSVSDFC